MPTMNVKDATGDTVAIEKPLAPGRTAAATSRPVALSTEDKTALDALATQTTAAAILAKIIAAPATEAKQDAAITQETAINSILGVAADAASATTTIKAALRGIATALGVTALDLGSGTGGSRTLRWFHDTAQWIGGAGAVTAAVQRTTLASDDPLVAIQSASAATVTALASAATSAQLLAANAARKGLILNNTDANAVLVKYGTTASATSFTVRIPLNGYWEMPKPIYTGRIDAIWEADGAGSLYATEL